MKTIYIYEFLGSEGGDSCDGSRGGVAGGSLMEEVGKGGCIVTAKFPKIKITRYRA